MKKTITLLLVMIVITVQSQFVIVGWDFPDDSADPVADTGIVENLNREIATFGGTSAIEMKNGYEDKAAQASGWDDGALTKGWEINFSTSGFYVIRLTSRQQSGGNDPGPRYWKIQYRIGVAGTWTDVEGSGYEVANDWETGYIEDLELPMECSSQELVCLRWMVTSNESTGGGDVQPDGKSKIDNILVTAEAINSIDEPQLANRIKTGPNPVVDHLNIVAKGEEVEYKISDLTGRVTAKGVVNGREAVDVSTFSKGMYVISFSDRERSFARKIMVGER